MNSVLYALQLLWCKIKDPKTGEYIGKLKESLYNIGTSLQDSLKGIRTTVENTQDMVDEFKDKTPKTDDVYKVEPKKDVVEK